MGEHLSTLRIIIGFIGDSLVILNTIDESLARPGEGILVRMKKKLTPIRWYVVTPIAVCSFIYFLPKIMNWAANWVNSLRSASTEFQIAWYGPAEKVSRIDKVIGQLTTVLPDANVKFLLS